MWPWVQVEWAWACAWAWARPKTCPATMGMPMTFLSLPQSLPPLGHPAAAMSPNTFSSSTPPSSLSLLHSASSSIPPLKSFNAHPHSMLFTASSSSPPLLLFLIHCNTFNLTLITHLSYSISLCFLFINIPLTPFCLPLLTFIIRLSATSSFTVLLRSSLSSLSHKCFFFLSKASTKLITFQSGSYNSFLYTLISITLRSILSGHPSKGIPGSLTLPSHRFTFLSVRRVLQGVTQEPFMIWLFAALHSISFSAFPLPSIV